jgi:hypothetical protein
MKKEGNLRTDEATDQAIQPRLSDLKTQETGYYCHVFSSRICSFDDV